MSTQRFMQGGWIRAKDLARGEHGRALCRWCSLEVPPRRRTFCSDWCVHEWRLRTDPGYLRDQVLARDRGICAICGTDTIKVWTRIRRARGPRRREALRAWGIHGMGRRSLWDADHIVPVAEGGGECDLSNLRTLCLTCHRKASAELRLRLAAKAQTADASHFDLPLSHACAPNLALKRVIAAAEDSSGRTHDLPS
jgi:5-methylcytosine-specific restriction protein A